MIPSLSSLPPIETERLHIRRLDPADAEALRVVANEPAILEAVHFLEHPLTRAEAEALIVGENGRDCFWGVWESGRPDLVGTVGTHMRGAEIEIGYWFAAAAQGRGLATEAVGAVVTALTHAFREHRIVAECRPENGASWRLLERIGFRPDGAAGSRPGRKRLVGPV